MLRFRLSHCSVYFCAAEIIPTGGVQAEFKLQYLYAFRVLEILGNAHLFHEIPLI